MLRFRAIALPLIRDLVSQMRFAPREALLRLIERAEAVADEIDPEAEYPRDWVIFRITGYRPEDSLTLNVPGRVLRADLGAAIDRWCEAAAITIDDVRGWLTPNELAAKWSVSGKTIARLRGEGLTARRVLGLRGRWITMIDPDRAEAFRTRNAERIRDASVFTRLTERERASVVRRAQRYRGRFGCSLNQAAARIATRFGRSHEAIRQILQRHEASRATFGERGPLTDAHAARILRALAWGIDPDRLAERYGRDARAIRLAALNERARRLKAMVPTATVWEGSGSIPASAWRSRWVTEDLGAPGPRSLGRLVSLARSTPPIQAESERIRTMVRRALVSRSMEATASLPSSGIRAFSVEAIEVDLIWASRVKAELIRSMLGVLIRTIETATGVPIERLRVPACVALVQAGLGALSETVDGFEPGKGGRLAGSAAVPLNRALQATLKRIGSEAVMPAGRALVPFDLASIEDFTRRVDPWQRWLEPPPWLMRAVRANGRAEEAIIVAERFGIGGPPQPLGAMAASRGMPLPVLARRLRAAMQALAQRGAATSS